MKPINDDDSESTVEPGLPVAPSMADALDAANVPQQPVLVDQRSVFVTLVAIAIGAVAAIVAQGLLRLIWFITGVSFYGEFSFEPHIPLGNRLGWWVLFIPALGGVIVGLMARYGSRAIRGHGIPEAMEQVITNQSRIPARLTFLKPLSAAIAIGTGGPFGAEGPIIATGGALGSVVGQLLRTTAMERKTLLAAGAAAGMAATFGAPISSVLLAIELLLFEFRPRSIIPVAIASATATAIRWGFDGSGAVFHMPDLLQPTGMALALYILIGVLIGMASVGVTRIVYAIEDGFDHLPIHWMWWPAMGGLVVGAVGIFHPRTLGVGYYNISDLLSGNLAIAAVASLAIWKFVSWSISLGSGTSGGTLAPLFTIGGALGALLGVLAHNLVPASAIDPRIAALIGMAAIFAGASRAMLTSVVFAFETTLQPLTLLPLLGGCAAAHLVSILLMRNTIMTEKIVRRGVRIPADYAADFLDQLTVMEVATRQLVTLHAQQTVHQVRIWLAGKGSETTHQGFPVLNGEGRLHSVITRRTLMDPEVSPQSQLSELPLRPPVVVYHDSSLRDAADQMTRHGIGRLPVIDRASGNLIGIVTRSDLLRAHRRRLADDTEPTRHLSLASALQKIVARR